MMTRFRALLIVLLVTGLSGCFTSREPLFGADQAVFPYQQIVWAEGDGAEPVTLRRDGDVYRFRPPGADSDGLLRLMEIGDLYLAELTFTESGLEQRLYAVLRVDLDEKTVESYAAVAPRSMNDLGFSACDDIVCIDDLDAYVAYARKMIEDGWPPADTYRIISLE